MKLLALGFITAFTLPAIAQPLETSFALEKRGNEVCRIQSGKTEQCLQTLESMSEFGKQPDGYELVDQLKKWKEVSPMLRSHDVNALVKPDEIGGAYLVDSARADLIVKTFSRLSLRNLAVQLDAKDKRVPFFASLYWKSASFPYPNGTVHIEGYMDLSQVLDMPLESAADVRKQIENRIYVQGIADSNTEQNMKALSFLESAGRSITFRVIGTEGQSIDEATVSLMKQVAGPMVFGQIAITRRNEHVAGELTKAVTEAFAKAIAEGLKGAIENALRPK